MFMIYDSAKYYLFEKKNNLKTHVVYVSIIKRV